MAVEDQAGVSLSEAAVARAETVDDLRRAVDEARTVPTMAEAFSFPRWTRRLWARAIRDASESLWILPLANMFMRRRVEGQTHLRQLRGPVIFASNHQNVP